MDRRGSPVWCMRLTHLPPTDRLAIVFPRRGNSLRPLRGRTGGEAARWGQVGVIPRQMAVSWSERAAERRTTSGVFELLPFRRSPSAPRDALSRSPSAGGALDALPKAPPADGSRSIGIPGPRAYPPHACRCRQPPRHTVSVIHARQGSKREVWSCLNSSDQDRRRSSPLDRPSPPHRSLAMRPFHASRWDDYAAALSECGE
jgi:hypothetical protein